jgi:hypothetical protein
MSAKLAEQVTRYPDHNSRWHAERFGLTTRRTSALLGVLKRRGWLVQRLLPIMARGAGGLEGRWFPSERLLKTPYTGAAYLDTADAVVEALGARTMTTGEINAAVGRPETTVYNAIKKLMKAGRVVSLGRTATKARLYRLANAHDVVDDDPDTPTIPYVNPIRARALGLPSAMRTVGDDERRNEQHTRRAA